MRLIALLTACLVSICFSCRVFAQAPAATVPNAAVEVNPAFQPIEDDPALPRVLLIGDSISIGYTIPLREALKGMANVHRPPENCGPTTLGLQRIDTWLGDKPWDVIHFNWGLHDLKFMGPQGQNLADPRDPANHRQVPPEEYERNLRQLVTRLQRTNAVLIWRTTTPIPPGARGRLVEDAARYNEIAGRVMKEHGIQIDDMYALAQPRLQQLQRRADVHFTAQGSKVLAEHSAQVILAALEQKE